MNPELLTLYRKFNTAMAADDVAALEPLLAPDFTLTHMTGYVQPRAEWLQEIAQGTMHYFSSVEEHVAITAVATGWQITGENKVTASIHGSGRHEWPLHTVLRVQQVAGQWQIMSSVVTTY
ncbi:nuclear transport factor 2 family protein [Levilactobacillus cerevisiae]|uniref:nuclear transport factor 2 family protein n=1 Tax=Levilactobacillus cerevisiae TaxID=1704076 RepID=UPI000F7B1E31|nr:nuclear transport factor 2 family protein [Levilactobacillus cerevisiae]